MKLRHPLLIRILAFFAALLVRLWIGTLRFRYRAADSVDIQPTARRLRQHLLYAFWHEGLLLPSLQYARPDVSLLVSEHADGELIATICRHLGYRLVRGSTTRNAVAALRQLMKAAQRGHLVLTPDGPQGPRRRFQPGLVFLAARTGRALVPTGLACRRGWRLKSWDRFILPCPFTEVWCVTALPRFIPAEATRQELETFRQQVEANLAAVTAEAERRAKRVDLSTAAPSTTDGQTA